MLSFFDCDLGVGQSGLAQNPPPTPAEALALLDRYHIQRALVYDRGATEAGMFEAFKDIADFCKGTDRLLPTIPVVPPATGEGPPPDELMGLIQTLGLKGVRVWPNVHAFDFTVSSFGKLLERLEARRVPVFYHSTNVTDHPWAHRLAWQNIREVALAFPKLPLIVIYSAMLEGRRVLPVLESCPNVLADLTCSTFQFIEYVCEKFGSERLVLASHHPLHDPGTYTTAISYSALPAEQRQDIAFGNLQRLVEGIR